LVQALLLLMLLQSYTFYYKYKQETQNTL